MSSTKRRRQVAAGKATLVRTVKQTAFIVVLANECQLIPTVGLGLPQYRIFVQKRELSPKSIFHRQQRAFLRPRSFSSLRLSTVRAHEAVRSFVRRCNGVG